MSIQWSHTDGVEIQYDSGMFNITVEVLWWGKANGAVYLLRRTAPGVWELLDGPAGNRVGPVIITKDTTRALMRGLEQALDHVGAQQ